MKILIAEDDEVSRFLLGRLLEKMGHDPILTTNGQEALKAYKENDFDMAILDWMMPIMDGIELCMKIRELEEGMDTPTYIFMVTAKSDDRDMVHALEAGVDDFLTKPVDKEKLKRRIERGLLYQTLVTSENREKHVPYLILTEEHNVIRRMIHILDVIYDKLESGVSEETLKWSASTLEQLFSKIHLDKEDQYFHLFINSLTAEHDFWFSDASESSFSTITKEHKDIETGLMMLMEEISESFSDAGFEISSLKLSLKEQTGLLLRHMYKEEKYFFPFVQKYLADDDQMKLLLKFEEIDSAIGKQYINRIVNEITQLLKLVTENEDNITTWKPSE